MRSFTKQINPIPELEQFFVNAGRDKWKLADFSPGPNDSRKIDTDVRKGLIYTNDLSELQATLAPLKKSLFESFGDVAFMDPELLMYKKGSYFKKHVDRIRRRSPDENTQLGTLLLIYYSSDAKGGELKVYPFATPQVLTSPSLGQWQMAFVAVQEPHEVTQLSEGNRVVYKETVIGMPPEDWNFNVPWREAMEEWFNPPTGPKDTGYSYRRGYERSLWQDNRKIVVDAMVKFVREYGQPPTDENDLKQYMIRWAQVKRNLEFSKRED